MNELLSYVQKARDKGLKDKYIRQRLIDTGWEAAEIYTALDGDSDLVPPAPNRKRTEASNQVSGLANKSDDDIHVIETGFSGNGFEYLIYFIALGMVALAVGAILHNTVDLLTEGSDLYTDIIPIAAAGLVVVAPIFLWLMLRLRRKEIASPDILQDRSRRRAIQFLLVITFLIGIVKLVGYIYGILTFGSGAVSSYGAPTPSLLTETLHALITVGLAGGIFGYYFRQHTRIK